MSQIQNDADEDVREQALSELVGFNAEISISHLKGLLDGTSDPDTRRLVLSAISRSEDPDRVDILSREIQAGSACSGAGDRLLGKRQAIRCSF